MNDKILISQEDLKVYRPTAELDEGRIIPYIKEAQINDLKPVLNNAFYYDFMLKFDDTTQGATYTAYNELLIGKVWTYNAQSEWFSGIIPMMCYYSLARFVQNNPFHVTRSGIVRKNITQSEQATPEEIRMIVSDLKSNALNYQNDLIKFLENNPTTYPLYNTGGASSEATRTTSFNFFKG